MTDLEELWERLPADAEEVMVVMEPTRNAWVPLAGWFRRRGAVVVMVPSEQSPDLRHYFSKHTKTDRLDAELLARLPVLHPEGLHLARQPRRHLPSASSASAYGGILAETVLITAPGPG